MQISRFEIAQGRRIRSILAIVGRGKYLREKKLKTRISEGMGKFQARNLGNGTIQVFLQQRYYLMTEAVVID